MLINCKKLINLPVYTKSGDYLGKVSDCDMDIESFVVQKFTVRKLLAASSLLVAKDQVLAITLQKMIVSDALVRKFAANENPALGVENIEPVITMDRD